MGLLGYGIGTGGGNLPPTEYDTARDIHEMRDQIVVPKRLKRWKSSQAPVQGSTAGTLKTGTVWIVDTGEDEINCLTVTIYAGTLDIYLSESEGTGIPDTTCGTLSPTNPIEIALTRDRYVLTFSANGADCKFSVLGKAL